MLTLKMEGLTGFMFCFLEIFCQSSGSEERSKNDQAFVGFRCSGVARVHGNMKYQEKAPFLPSFFFSSNKYFLNVCYTPSTLLGVEDILANKPDKISSLLDLACLGLIY